MVCHVKEEIQPNLWYLDTGCSNHMCGDKKAFSGLDESFRSTVKFGDNSTVRDVVFDEEATWSWKEDKAKQYIPIACDDNEEREKPMENVQVVEGNQNVPIADRSPLVAESQRPQRHRRRPAWIEDYEVTGVDQVAKTRSLGIVC
ncbi:hypothetical protein KIW84_014060 [Lathyrus oleraceus]|uniref:Retrovirus-related Pol polyprotein from transposon TNT 1-94-like beta-barrel domain-containing protein n=1 Tax=Pisum sativum TaxID=3888 RepID=A0A9D5BM46_PEA|nr:hypothetical protein KIW84_014060 [Pisum sativum]